MTASGVLVLFGKERRFVPARVAQRILQRAVISSVPGSSLGMTLFEGRVIGVLELGPERAELLVCELDSELVGVSGLKVLETGYFEAAPGGVRVGSELVAELDLLRELQRSHRALSHATSVGGTT